MRCQYRQFGLNEFPRKDGEIATESKGGDAPKKRYLEFAEKVRADNAKIEAIKQAEAQQAAYLHTDVVHGFLNREKDGISKLFDTYGRYEAGSGKWEKANLELYKLATGKESPDGRAPEVIALVKGVQSGLVGLAPGDIDGKAGPQTLNAIAATVGLGSDKIASFTKGDRVLRTPEITRAQAVTFKPNDPQVGETVHLAVTGKESKGTLQVRGPDGTVIPLEDGNFKPDKEGTYQVYQEAGMGLPAVLLAVLMVLGSGAERVKGAIGKAPGAALLRKAVATRTETKGARPPAKAVNPVEAEAKPPEKAAGPFDAEIIAEREKLSAAQERLKASQTGIDHTNAELGRVRSQQGLLVNNAKQLERLPASMQGDIGEQVKDLKVRQETLEKKLNEGIAEKERIAVEIKAHENNLRGLERKNRAAVRAKTNPAPKSEKALRQQETASLKEKASEAREGLANERAELGKEFKDARSTSQFEKKSGKPLTEFDGKVNPALRRLAEADREITAQEKDVKDWKQMAVEEGISESVRQQRTSSLAAKETRLTELKTARTALVTEVQTATTEAADASSKGIRNAFNVVAEERVAQIEAQQPMAEKAGGGIAESNRMEIGRLKAKAAELVADSSRGRSKQVATPSLRERYKAWWNRSGKAAADSTPPAEPSRTTSRTLARPGSSARVNRMARLQTGAIASDFFPELIKGIGEKGGKSLNQLRARLAEAKVPEGFTSKLLGVAMLAMSVRSWLQAREARARLDGLQAEIDRSDEQPEVKAVMGRTITDLRTMIDAQDKVTVAWGTTAAVELGANVPKIAALVAKLEKIIPPAWLPATKFIGGKVLGPLGAGIAGFFEWKAATTKGKLNAKEFADIKQLDEDIKALGLDPEQLSEVQAEVKEAMMTMIRNNTEMQKFLSVVGSASVLTGPGMLIIAPLMSLVKAGNEAMAEEQLKMAQGWRYWYKKARVGQTDLAQELLAVPHSAYASQTWAATGAYSGDDMPSASPEIDAERAKQAEAFEKGMEADFAKQREAMLTAMLYLDEQQQVGIYKIEGTRRLQGHVQARLERIKEAMRVRNVTVRQGKREFDKEDTLLLFRDREEINSLIRATRDVYMSDRANEFEKANATHIVSKHVGADYIDYIINNAGGPTGYKKAYFNKRDANDSNMIAVEKDANGNWVPHESVEEDMEKSRRTEAEKRGKIYDVKIGTDFSDYYVTDNAGKKLKAWFSHKPPYSNGVEPVK